MEKLVAETEDEKRKMHLINDMSPEEIYQARLIVAQGKFWTPEIEKLFRRWKRQINIRREGHQHQERTYNKRYYYLGVPANIFGTIVASGVLSTFKNCDVCASPTTSTILTTIVTTATISTTSPTASCSNDEIIRLVMGIIAVFSLCLTILMVFMDYGGGRQANKDSGDNCDGLSRKIEGMLNTPISRRGDPIEFLHEIRNEFDDIRKNSPALPSKYNSTLEYRTIERKKSKTPSMTKLSPTVSPSTPPKMSPKASQKMSPKASPKASLKAKSKSTGSLPSSKSLRASKIAKKVLKQVAENEKETTLQLEKANDYDTDEEDKEVTLAFDIESLRPDDILNDIRRKSVQHSLTKALEFELSRMYTDETRSPPIRRKRKSSSTITRSDDVVIVIGSEDKGKEEDL
jgi:hypothetical protein